MKGNYKKIVAGAVSALMLCSAFCLPQSSSHNTLMKNEMLSASAQTINDMPSEYEYAASWIWENRIQREKSTERWNTLFDQLIAGKGSLNYVVKWQSYKQITPEQRKGFQRVLSDAVNAWNDRLAGYENWPYDHIDVNIVGWAVIDKNSIIDPSPDEIIYTDTRYYDSQYDTSNGTETIPDREPYAPDELSRMYHFEHRLDPAFDAYNYPGGLDKRFDMYMWATEGFPAIGGCGGDWGQRLSDTAYLNMIDGTFPHVQVHEVGHAFGITDFYGGEGEIDGFPPGGFPGNGSSIMMAGSSMEITDFDGWLLRYMWTKIKDEAGRFDIENAHPNTTTTITTTTTTTTITSTTTTTEPVINTSIAEFSDTIDNIVLNESGNTITFSQNGTYNFSGTDYFNGDESKNLAYYEAGDKVSIKFIYNTDTSTIISIEYITLEQNFHKVKGDVNADNEFSLSDIIMMQRFLIKTDNLIDWEAGDLNEDGKINIFDIAIMKELIIENK